MVQHLSETSKVGWNFDNSYARLPDIMLSKLLPIPVKNPKPIILNEELSKELGLNFSNLSEESIASIFSGNVLPVGSEPIAQAYAGHQFGHFTMLGDGRAIVVGEHITPDNKQVDIQYKGSGQTPYSRGADGRAALGPMLREYIISEAVHALSIPTTRSLAVVTTGENIFREVPLPGAILTRVAASHLRIGTFQYVASTGDLKTLKTLVDYAINRHYPDLKNGDNLPLNLLKAVMERQIELVINWMRVGFIHGVMNTDNTTVSGETIDYGPCAFMDQYNINTVFSSIDVQGRYSFGNQPSIIHWNLIRFAEALVPLINDNQEKAVLEVSEVLKSFSEIYNNGWIKMMKAKLGFYEDRDGDEVLINDLLSWMQLHKADYTNTFCKLMGKVFANDKVFENEDFLKWYQRWIQRIKQNEKSEKNSQQLMQKTNPVIIPRNYIVEEALFDATNKNDLSKLKRLIRAMESPYKDHPDQIMFQATPEPSEKIYQTFCGT